MSTPVPTSTGKIPIELKTTEMTSQKEAKETDKKDISEDLSEICDGSCCDDCGRSNYLIKKNACADYECCFKLVCEDYCVFKCSQGHDNQVKGSDDGEIGQVTCSVCKEQWTPEFHWHGISMKEYRYRYE